MAARDYYRCKRCDAKIAYGPDRSNDNWEPFLLCRSCMANDEKEICRLREVVYSMWPWTLIIESAVRRADPANHERVLISLKLLQEVVKELAAAKEHPDAKP